MHPCLTCGACCASYRVSFYWGELASAGGGVPDALVEQVAPFLVAMTGTARGATVRCTALEGAVGHAARCAIYELRPSPCHELKPSWEDGTHDDRCDRARVRWGLPPLLPCDWPESLPRAVTPPAFEATTGAPSPTPPPLPTRR